MLVFVCSFRASIASVHRLQLSLLQVMAPKQRMTVANSQFSKNVVNRGNVAKSLVSFCSPVIYLAFLRYSNLFNGCYPTLGILYAIGTTAPKDSPSATEFLSKLRARVGKHHLVLIPDLRLPFP